MLAALHSGQDEGGPPALTAFGGDPCRTDCHELARWALSAVNGAAEPWILPGLPAERLAGDPSLAERTREQAPSGRLEADAMGAIEAFLKGEERIERIERKGGEGASGTPVSGAWTTN